MRPRPGPNGRNRIRFIAATAVVGIIAVGGVGCGGDDATKSASSGPGKGTYVNRSSAEEYCAVLEDVKANLDAGVDADDDSVLTAIQTINDIEPLAPEESKADWSGLRLIMRAVVDANGSETVASMSRAEAGEVYAKLSARVSKSVNDICGFPLS